MHYDHSRIVGVLDHEGEQGLDAHQLAYVRQYPDQFFAWEREARVAIRAAGLRLPDILEMCAWCCKGLTADQVVEAIRAQDRQFTIRKLAKVSYAEGFTAWVYRSPNQPMAEMLAPEFFALAHFTFRHGDLLTILGSDAVAQRGVIYRDGRMLLEALV